MSTPKPPPGWDAANVILGTVTERPVRAIPHSDSAMQKALGEVFAALPAAVKARREAFDAFRKAREAWKEADTVFARLIDALDEASAPGHKSNH